MKICISYPPLLGPGSPMLTQNRQFQWYNNPSYIYPLVSAQAATLLKNDGFLVIWNDCIAEKWTYGQFLEFIKKEKPDLIAMETKTPVIKQHWKIINEIKGQSPSGTVPKVVLFGDHVTVFPEESMKNSRVDFVITGGDYDTLLHNIAKHKRDGSPLEKGIWYRQDGQIKNTGLFELKQDLDKLPFIDRGLTKSHSYGEKWKRRMPFFYTMAGRDCLWGKCSFCAWSILYPKPRLRNPDNLLEEIEMLIKDYSAKEIFDDMGTFPTGEWLHNFCAGMIKRGLNKKIIFSCNMRFGALSKDDIKLMKEAGFAKLKMGLESANQETLNKIGKGITVDRIIQEANQISMAGLKIHLTVMVGYPWETKREALNTLRLTQKMMNNGWIDMLQSTVVVPYPGTPLHSEGIRNNWFRIDPQDYDRYGMKEPVFKLPDMGPDELMQICSGIYKSFFSFGFMARNLKSVRSISDIAYLFKGVAAVIGHINDFCRRK